MRTTLQASTLAAFCLATPTPATATVMVQAQIGSAERTTNTLARRIREVMPDVLVAYPHAKVEVTSHGLLRQLGTAVRAH